MRVDENSQLFLLLVWLVTIVALIASIWLLKDVKSVAHDFDAKTVIPNVVPREAQSKPQNGFVVPPPPWQ